MLLIEIQNISEMRDVSDYKYQVLVTTIQGGIKTLAKGTIVNHVREDGWRILVGRMLNDAVDVG